MNLKKKKILAAKTLKLGKERIVFLESRLNEVKEAITKHDIRDLKNSGAIFIKEIKGRRKKKIIKKRSPGNIRKKVNKRKKEYASMTRKLRKHTSEMKKQGKISKEENKEIRKKIRNRIFKSGAHLKNYIGGLKSR